MVAAAEVMVPEIELESLEHMSLLQEPRESGNESAAEKETMSLAAGEESACRLPLEPRRRVCRGALLPLLQPVLCE